VSRLGSTAATLKLKGIDGGSHKRWTTWLNSMISEEPYQGLTCQVKFCRKVEVRKALGTGAAWLSSAGAVRCSLKWGNLRNPRPAFQVSRETARDNLEEGEDDAKSAWPLRPGQHTWYNGRHNGLPSGNAELIPSKPVSVRIEV